MKKLTKLKLINWHRFSNSTIEFGDSTLISGENGAGKSTLLDAIQFVVTGSASHFNKAAHENGKRKLTGYIRCKTGIEDRPYERTGAISAHVAMEFYEEKRDRYFVVGAVVDSASEGQETVARYLIDDEMLADEMFMEGNRPRTITEFRTFNGSSIKTFAKTNAEAKRMIKQRFGRIEDKFFKLIPKALAFKPIDDIKDFVYSYVLDEKEVNIDTLRENVRSYQELEKTLEGVKNRIENLKTIEERHQEVKSCLESDRMYEYFLVRSESDIIDRNIKSLKEKIEKEKYRHSELLKMRNDMQHDIKNKNEIYTAILVELKQNREYQIMEEQKKRMEDLCDKRDAQKEEQKHLLDSRTRALKKIEKLSHVDDIDPCVEQYKNALRDLEEIEDLVPVKGLTDRVIAYKKELYNRLHKDILESNLKLEKIIEEKIKTEQNIRKLERKKFSYPPSVELLRDSIEQEFLRIGRTAEPKILCELLEISDEKWRNAVEGYMNTQRFHILVDPEHFDIALGIYERLRKERKVYGAGLINTGKLDGYDMAPENSLAAVVDSKSLYAKRYINMLMGRVVRCERIDDLKKFDVSITANCMRYQNHVASAIKPQIFEVPFIGKNAVKIQMEQAIETKQILIQKEEKERSVLKGIKAAIDLTDSGADMDVKYNIDIIPELRRTEISITKCRKEIDQLEKHSTIIEKQIRSEELKAEIEQIQDKVSQKDREIGSCEANTETAEINLDEAKAAKEIGDERKGILVESAGEKRNTWDKEYDRQMTGKTYEQFRSNFDRRRKANNTSREKAEEKMIASMVDYKTSFDFGAPATFDAYPEYEIVYDRLITSELLDYEEKVMKAKLSAEEEFREQFLSKLQENMKQAQGEFKT